MTLNSFRNGYKAVVNNKSSEKNIKLKLNKNDNKPRVYWKPLLISLTCLVMLFIFNFQSHENHFVFLPLADDVETEYSGGREIKLLGINDDNVYYALTTRSSTENRTEIYKYYTKSNKTTMVYQLESNLLLLVDDNIIYVNPDQTNQIEILNINDLVNNDLYTFDQNTLIKAIDYQDHYLFIVYENHESYELVKFDMDTKMIDYKEELIDLSYPIAYDDGSLLYLNDNNEIAVLNMTSNIIVPTETFNERVIINMDIDVLQITIAKEKLYYIDNKVETSLWYYDLTTEQIVQQTILSEKKCFSEKIYYDETNSKLYIALQEDSINKIYCFDMITNLTKLITEFEYGRVWDIYINENSYAVSVDDGIIVGNIR